MRQGCQGNIVFQVPENGTVVFESIDVIRVFRAQLAVDEGGFVVVVQVVVAVGQMRQHPWRVEMFQRDRLEQFDGLPTFELRQMLKALPELLENVDDVFDDFYAQRANRSS